MKFFKQILAVLAVVAALAPAAARADDDGVKVTIGVKYWLHNWSTWFTPATTTSLMQTSETGNTGAIIPSVSVRFGDFFIAGDYFPETEYDFVNSVRGVKRSEWSIIGGYYIVPQLAIAGGYKVIYQTFSSSFDIAIGVPMIGLQGGSAIGDSGWFMYGNGFFGPISVSDVQTGTVQNQDGFYYSTELGLGVRVGEHVSLTGGYKYQTIRWEDITRGMPGNDLTNGWVFGLSFTF